MTAKKLLALVLCLSLLPILAAAQQGPVYEVFVASFADGNGDQVGDLKGLTGKLDYIQSLSVKGLWLMPISPSPSYHKYDVTDYLSVDPTYGNLADFRALADASHQRGIRLILDLVFNHSSDQHPWFMAAADALKNGTDSPYTKYYHFSRDGAGHPVPGADGWTYMGHFGPHMPDLNLDDPQVRAEIVRIMAFWLENGADGFRLDATTHYYEEHTANNTAFLAWLKEEAVRLSPDATLVAEAWKDEGTILSLYESGADSFFNFPMAGSTGWFISALREKRGHHLSARVESWNADIRARNPKGLDAPFLSNHDMARSAGYLMYRPQMMKQAAAVYLTMPGIPYVYYGEELGMSGSGRDENKRLPMLWGGDGREDTLPPEDADQVQRQRLGVMEQEQDNDSLLNFYKGLLALRALCPELTHGVPTAFSTEHNAIAAWRVTDGGSSVLVLHNLSDQPLTIPLPPGDMVGAWDTGGGQAVIQDHELVLAPHAGSIFR